MAKINIRGLGAVSRTRAVAQDLLSFKNDPQYSASDKYIQHGFDIEKRDIGPIDLDEFEVDDKEASASRKDANNEHVTEIFKEHRDDIRKKSQMPWHIKAKNTAPYETVYFAIKQHRATEDFRSEIIRRQEQYFQAHPRHAFAILEVKDLLPEAPNLIGSRLIEHVYKAMYSGNETASTL